MALLEGTTFKIRKIASTLGCIIAVLPGVMYGKLHYRFIEQDKNLALKLANGDFEQTMQLSRSSLSDLLWWRENINHATNVIYHLPVELTLYSDASLEGWGGTDMSHSVGGRWSPVEEISHINVLELYAAKLVLQSLAKRLHTCHIKLLLDNTTAISYVNRMGGTHSPQLNSLARVIWFWAIERKIWLSAAHIPGCENAIAEDNTEWTLGKAIFGKIFNLFQPQLDLFASRLNSQLKAYVSWHPEPDSWAVDAFSLNWNTLKFYAFPPFSLLGRTLSKIRQDQAEGILIAPLWSTQPWFPLLMKLVMEDPLIIFPHKRNLLLPPNFQEAHPLFKHLKLLVVHVSGRPSENSTYLQKLLPSSMTLGDREPGHSTILLSENGNNIVFKGKLIPLNPSLIDVATFLTALYTSGANYNVVATAQSTLSGLIQIPGVPSIGSHPIIKRVFKGVYNNRPPKAKYHYIWDTSIVMDYLGLQITEAIGFKALTLKTATLLTILSGQRVSTVHKFKLSGLHFTDKTAIFSIVSDILKHSKPSRKLEPIVFKKFPHYVELCPVRTHTIHTGSKNTPI